MVSLPVPPSMLSCEPGIVTVSVPLPRFTSLDVPVPTLIESVPLPTLTWPSEPLPTVTVSEPLPTMTMSSEPLPTRHRVGAVPRRHAIGTIAEAHLVVAVAEDHAVGAVACGDPVVALPVGDEVVPITGVDAVVAVEAVDPIAPTEGVDEVAAVGPVEEGEDRVAEEEVAVATAGADGREADDQLRPRPARSSPRSGPWPRRLPRRRSVPAGSELVVVVATPPESVSVPSEVGRAARGAAGRRSRCPGRARRGRDGVGEADRGAQDRRVGRLVRTEVVPSALTTWATMFDVEPGRSPSL